jgi:elongation factor P
MINVNDLRNGTTFQENGILWEVLEYSHTKMGRGTATIRVKVRNLKTGSLTEKTFISGAKVEEADLEKKEAQFLYSTDKTSSFMDKMTFEQFQVPNQVLGSALKFLQEGEDYSVLTFEKEVLKVEIPRTVELKVVDSPPGVRGDTVSNVYKSATLENGMILQVPLFIEQGDTIKVDTRSAEYIERVKK